MRKIDLKSVVWKEGKYYVSQCLEVDISSFGKTKKEALKMLREAFELYFEDQPLPKKSEIKNPTVTAMLSIEILENPYSQSSSRFMVRMSRIEHSGSTS